MRILLTGANGLVGKCMIKTNDDLIPLYSNTVDLRNYNEIYNFLNNNKFDGIIHLASIVGGVYFNINNQLEMLQDNTLMNINILKAAHAHNIKRVLCCLSTCIFPDNVEYPIKSDMLHEGMPPESNEGYAYSKRILHLLCKHYRKQYNREYFTVIPCNIYGPGDTLDINRAHVIPSIIMRCLQNPSSLTVKGGKNTRQFIYNEDVAKIIYWSFFNYNNLDKPLMIVPSKSEITIENVVKIITELCDYKGTINFEDDGKSQLKRTCEECELEFKFTNMKTGLLKTIKWYKDQIVL